MMDWVQFTISNVAVASLIASLAWLAGRSAHRAQLAHTLWIVFFVKLITPPLIEVPVIVPHSWMPQMVPDPTQESSAAEPTMATFRPVEESAVEEQSSNSEAVGATRGNRWLTITGAIPWIWAFGLTWILVRGFARFHRFQRLLHREAMLDEGATAYVAGLVRSDRHQDGGRSPDVLRVPVRVAPMLFGFGHRAVIVCPDELWQSLSESERHAFLTHEAAHFCRRDHWVRWLEWLVMAAWWWFPFVYVARYQLERSEELCCDAWAVRRLNGPPRQYAEALLKVVDFISVHRAGIPQLATGMLPTDSLEERLRLVMQSAPRKSASKPVRFLTAAACCTLLLLHPIPQAAAKPHVSEIEIAAGHVAVFSPPTLPPGDSEATSAVFDESQLPPVPQGYWNRKPKHQWADFSLSFSGAYVTASASIGVSIELPTHESLHFSADEFRAIADIPDSQRIVIGGHDGSVRVWDLKAGTPVSLLGRHTTGVTSLAHHESGGLVSADSAGVVVRWDLQSGDALATASVSSMPVQSVRFSRGGRLLAVLCGTWDATLAPQTVTVLESDSLGTFENTTLSDASAVVISGSDDEWLSVDWSGTIRSLQTGQVVGQVDKQQVSAMVLAQDFRVPN